MVSGVAMVRTGSAFDPPGRSGLAMLTGVLLRSGGSGGRTPGQLDAELERLGASIDSNIGETMGTVSFSTLAENTAPVLALFRDLLTSPAFRLDRVDFAKTALLNGVSRRNDDPEELLRREFRGSRIWRRERSGPSSRIQQHRRRRTRRNYLVLPPLLLPRQYDAGDFGRFQERRDEGGDRSPVCGVEGPTAARPRISKRRHSRERRLPGLEKGPERNTFPCGPRWPGLQR